MLSATPFNPVTLDSIDSRDVGASDDTFEEQHLMEEEALADEVQKTLGVLSQLAGLKRGPWFDEHIESARRRLADGANGRALNPPVELIVWPASVQQRAFRPPAAGSGATPAAVVRRVRAKGPGAPFEELVRLLAGEVAVKREAPRALGFQG